MDDEAPYLLSLLRALSKQSPPAMLLCLENRLKSSKQTFATHPRCHNGSLGNQEATQKLCLLCSLHRVSELGMERTQPCVSPMPEKLEEKPS